MAEEKGQLVARLSNQHHFLSPARGEATDCEEVWMSTGECLCCLLMRSNGFFSSGGTLFHFLLPACNSRASPDQRATCRLLPPACIAAGIKQLLRVPRAPGATARALFFRSSMGEGEPSVHPKQ